MQFNEETKIKVVKSCLAGMARADIVLNFKVHPVTLWRWIKKYRSGGIKSLTTRRSYKRPWNKFMSSLDVKVADLKELEPSLSLTKARKILAEKGVRISEKGIWNIWRRYGLTGFIKQKFARQQIFGNIFS